MFFWRAMPETPLSHRLRTRFSQLGKHPEIGLELRKHSGPVFDVRDLLIPCGHDFDSEIVRTDTVMFRSSCETAPEIGPFRGPCRIQTSFHASCPQIRPTRPTRVLPLPPHHPRGFLVSIGRVAAITSRASWCPAGVRQVPEINDIGVRRFRALMPA